MVVKGEPEAGGVRDGKIEKRVRSICLISRSHHLDIIPRLVKVPGWGRRRGTVA